MPQNTRPYAQSRRALSTAATRARLLEATADLLREAPAQGVTLRAVADRAGSTEPTLLRHFAGKDALVAAALGEALAAVRAARPRVDGEPRVAARVLASEYESNTALLRAAEAALPGARAQLEPARRLHRDWLARTFTRTLSPLPPVVHRRRLAQLVAVSAPGPWRTLRDTEQLGPVQAEAALVELLRALSR